METGRPSGNLDNNNDRPAPHSGLALLSAYEWLDVLSCVKFYDAVTLRFTSGALNRLIHRKSSTLPLRVIASLNVGYRESTEVYSALSFEPWSDLEFESRASPESLLREVLSKCKGLVVAGLELHNLPYNERVMDILKKYLPLITVSKVTVNGVASGHDQVPRLLEIVPGIREVSFDNEADPNAAAVLSVCAARKIPAVSLLYAVDVTDAQILDFLFENNSATIARLFGILGLYRSVSDNFFEMIVERCRRNNCKSFRFALGCLLTDPADAKYSRFVVERDDIGAMYKFDRVGQTDLPFTILVGKTRNFYLAVLQGIENDLCSSLDAARKIPIGAM